MMKLIEAAREAALDDYAVRDAAMPCPAPGEVLIKVAACGVSYVDALVALGRYQIKPALPHVPGAEVAGEVAALGAGVTGFAVGDRVLALVSGGGFAQYALGAAERVRHVPASLRFEQAVCLPVNYLTALHGLRDRGQLAAGERLLVFGAAGGVGAAAIQVGAALGAEVIAVASTPAKRAVARDLGATAVIDRDPDGWRDRLKALAPGGIDVVYDPATGALFEPAFRSLRWGGRHLVVGFASGTIPALPANLPLLKGAALIGVDSRQFLMTYGVEQAARHLDQIIAWAESGRIAPPVGRIFEFADYRAALTLALSGESLGKTILRMT
jgi:NADPH2:quinone reductase